MNNKYDIFISYRRKWGALYSRILQLKLQEKGYKVFLDYDELRDGKFDEKIKLCERKTWCYFRKL